MSDATKLADVSLSDFINEQRSRIAVLEAKNARLAAALRAAEEALRGAREALSSPDFSPDRAREILDAALVSGLPAQEDTQQ